MMYKKFLAIFSCLSVIVCGCSKKEILQGKRENIEGITYTEFEVADRLKNTSVILPNPSSVKELTELYGGSQHLAINNSLSPKLNIKWRKDLKEDPVVSNILVLGNYIYAMNGCGKLFCISKNSGKKVWSSKVVEQPQFGTFSGGITNYKSVIYIVSNTSDVIAFDVALRKVIWKRTLDTFVKSTPVYASGKLIVTTASNKTYALNANTGNILWKYASNKEQLSCSMLGTPAVYKDSVICVYSNGDVVSLKLADGSVNWYEVLIPKSIVRSGSISLLHISASPTIIDDKVFVINSSSTMSLFDAQSGMRIWSRDIGSTSQPAIVNKDWVFLLSDMDLLCISLKDGSVKWHVNDYKKLVQKSRKFKKQAWFGPLVVNNQIWIFSELGSILKYDASTGNCLEQSSLRNVRFSGTPVIVGDTMYAQGNGRLYAIG